MRAMLEEWTVEDGASPGQGAPLACRHNGVVGAGRICPIKIEMWRDLAGESDGVSTVLRSFSLLLVQPPATILRFAPSKQVKESISFSSFLLFFRVCRIFVGGPC